MAQDRAENRAYHFTYKVTCTNTARVFYGIHSANILYSRFIGAGSALYESKKDHGVENHIFAHLEIFKTRKEAKIAYAELKASELLNPKKPGDYAFHYVYCITRTDGKYYVGVHSTNNMNDRYMGSGARVSRSIKKHGRAAHTREIIQLCESREQAFDVEKRLINAQMLNDPQCMNLGVGGEGGAHRVYGVSEQTRQKLSEHFKNIPRTNEWKARIGAANRGKVRDPEVGKAHSARLKGRTSNAEHVAARTVGQLSSEKFKKRYRPIIADGVTYQNGREAVAALNIPGSTLTYRLKSPAWTAYRWADQPEKTGVHLGLRAHRGSYTRTA